MPTSLGLVGITNKGTYDAQTPYVKGNFVYHNGSTWLLIANTATGIEPNENNSATWQYLAKGFNVLPFTGATALLDGTGGTVPQPHAGDEDKLLAGDGNWRQVDTTPTNNSKNPVRSGGVKTELDKKLTSYTNDANSWDTVPTQNSEKPVTSGGLYAYIAILVNRVNELETNGNWRNGLRYKNLGASFTAEQQTALANGDFTEFWNGDFWLINDVTWRIVDNTNFYKNRGNAAFTDNHLLIMPDNTLIGDGTYQSNNLIDTENSGHGYGNCDYRTRTDGKGREQCKLLFSNAFGVSHIATYKAQLTSARGTNGATGKSWQDADVELPSEVNLFGHSVWSSSIDSDVVTSGYNIGTNWGRFKLFELAPQYVLCNRKAWLRDIFAGNRWVYVDSNGDTHHQRVSNNAPGFRPYACLI